VPSRRYEFRVAGRVSERTRGAFPDMSVVDAPPETIIFEVIDESHLHGVLALIQTSAPRRGRQPGPRLSQRAAGLRARPTEGGRIAAPWPPRLAAN
jgi:hypothetical protein